jgi:ABC-type uncharacterized transport system involved in gliding motility auxiliary subunit
MQRFSPVAGWLAVFFGFAGLFAYIVFPDKPFPAITLVLIAVGNAAFFLAVDWHSVKKTLRGRSAVYGFNTTVLIFVCLGILIFANLIALRHKHRIDTTEAGLFSLAPKTKNIAAKLPREIKLTAFFQTESPERSKFKNLIDGYIELTDKIKLEFVDPDKNPAATKKYGVTVYGTVILESGKQETKITNVNEENLTNALLKATNDEQKAIYFLEGHGEKQLDSTDKEGYSSLKGALEKDNYNVAKLLLMQSGKVPANAAALIIAGPQKPLLPDEARIVTAYLENGGSVFLLTDPDTETGLESFLQTWGIALTRDYVVDPMSRLFGVDSRAPVVNQYTHHDITKNFTLATILPLVRSVNVKPTPGVKTTKLLQTAETSWAETEFNSLQIELNEGKEQKGPIPVMVVAVKSPAIKNTPPAKPDEPDEGKDDTAKKSLLVVLGDSDFAANNYFKFSGNGDLFLNTVAWLAQEENLISIGVKERSSAPVQLSRTQGIVIFLLGIIVFPGLVVVTGVRVWWKRRKL